MLICELKLSPLEAYNRVLKIVHKMNGIMSVYKSESDVDSIYLLDKLARES